jgi:hypothetical protein
VYPSLSNKFTLYLFEGMKKTYGLFKNVCPSYLMLRFIMNDDATVEKIIEYMQLYRSNLELTDYSLYNCDAQLVPFDNPTLKLAAIKNHVVYMIKNKVEFKLLEIHLIDLKKRYVAVLLLRCISNVIACITIL